MPGGSKSLIIEFVVLDFTNPAKHSFIFKLEGYDEEWSPPSGMKLAVYTNLPPGEYTFLVKGTNGEGIWSMQPAKLAIVIKPLFWQTTVFKIIAGLLIIGLITGLVYFRVRQLERRAAELESIIKNRTSELSELNSKLSAEIIGKELKEKKLSELNAQREKLYSIIAHDLRSPFFGLQGLSEILIEDYKDLSDDQKLNMIMQIKDLSQNTYSLLENLLNWTKLELGKIPFHPRHINLGEVINNVIRLYSLMIETKRINVSVNIEPGTMVFADKNMLEFIVRNLLNNAVKFTAPGGKVRINTAAINEGVLLSVNDTGIGISENKIKMILDKDIHFTTAGTHEEKGSGLGLLLVQEMIHRHGGKLEIKSKEGEGSLFMVMFPHQKKSNHSNADTAV